MYLYTIKLVRVAVGQAYDLYLGTCTKRNIIFVRNANWNK